MPGDEILTIEVEAPDPVELAKAQGIAAVESARARQRLAANPRAGEEARIAAKAADAAWENRSRRGCSDHRNYPATALLGQLRARAEAHARADLFDALAAGEGPTWPLAPAIGAAVGADLLRAFAADTKRAGAAWLADALFAFICQDKQTIPLLTTGPQRARRATMEARVAVRHRAWDAFLTATPARFAAAVSRSFSSPTGLAVALLESSALATGPGEPDPVIAAAEQEMAEVRDQVAILRRDRVARDLGGGLIARQLNDRWTAAESALAERKKLLAEANVSGAESLAARLVAGGDHRGAWKNVLNLAEAVGPAFPPQFGPDLVEAMAEAMIDAAPELFAKVIEARIDRGVGVDFT